MPDIIVLRKNVTSKFVFTSCSDHDISNLAYRKNGFGITNILNNIGKRCMLKLLTKESSRRDFMNNLVIAPAALAVLSVLQGCSTKKYILPQRSKIIRVTHPDATDKTGGKDNENLNDIVVHKMVEVGIKAFTGKESVEEGWREIIPDPNKKVAIKVNCQITGIYTKSKVMKAVTDGLILRGVSPSNIIIYDLTDNAFSYAGFKKNLSSGIKIGTVSELGGFSWFSYFGIPIRGVGRRFCKVLAGEGRYGCDYLINIPVLKALDGSLEGCSGVTLSMKNHFGSISYCRKLHPTVQDSLAALNAHKLIVKKTRLILVDAIFGEYKWVSGRSQDYVETTNQLLFGNDPVAIDYTGWQMIEKLRQHHGLNPVDPKPIYIHKAAVSYGLGNDDPKKIDLIDI